VPDRGSRSVDAVIFDFHSTLVDQGDGRDWVERAWGLLHLGLPAEATLARDTMSAVATRLDRVWEGARAIDPESRRDLDPATHRAVFAALMDDLVRDVLDGVLADPHALVEALYATVTDLWTPYTDTLPTLRELRRTGVKVALLSNIGLDIRGVLDRTGLADLLDAVVLSYEVGLVKPQPEIFAHTLDVLGVPAERALMVGDSWKDDAGAAELGCRVLILPRTWGPEHGLDQVLRIVG